jgi:hypothetical protein
VSSMPLLVTGALLVGAALYLLPTVVAVRRDALAVRQVVLLNVLLGWTAIGWGWSLALATGPRRPLPSLPRTTSPPPSDDFTYRDGAYLLSRSHDTTTWAICKRDRWTIVYEMGGANRLIGDVPARDVPLDVLAQALVAREGVR